MLQGGNEGNGKLAELLASALPEASKYRFYHVSTPPTRCRELYAPLQGVEPERTYCESHFLNVTIRPEGRDACLSVLAIEVLIFSTKSLTTVFVSKADSTGYLTLLNLPKSHPSPLRTISTTFLSYLIRHRQRPAKRLVLSLFARAQDQYLYPGSVENAAKHVSTDRALIRWWCRVIDPLLRVRLSDGQDGGDQTSTQAYLIVPGEESTTSFLPPSVRANPALRDSWKHGHPLHLITSHPGAPPRCLIPHFPDDPKARFLDELDAELPDTVGSSQQDSPSKRGKGLWKSVRTVDHFWEMMVYRQECSSGRLVGFFWVVFTPTNTPSQPGNGISDSQASTMSLASDIDPPSSPTERVISSAPPAPSGSRRTLTGPIVPRLPRIKKASSSLSNTSRPDESAYYLWPAASRGTIVLAEKDYKRAIELLLKLDFANEEIAAASTRRWIGEVGVYSGLGDWGFKVVGRKAAGPTAEAEHSSIGIAILKPKRKAEAGDGAVPATAQDSEGANLLGAGLVRKKAKLDIAPEPPPVAEVGSPAGVNTLGTGLVRKKPKA